MPPPAVTDVAFDQFAEEPEPADELLLHPAARTTVPITAAMVTTALFLRTIPLRPAGHVEPGREHRREET
jgi:hypothetical protein